MATTGEHHPVDAADASASGAPTLVAGRYRIERRLARGGQASVYLAHQEPLGRMVALKVLAPPMDTDHEERERFQQRFLLEAKTLASLDHPHIVTVYDYGQTDAGDLYIAMEYVDGVRFNDLLRHGRLEVDRALALVRQVCSALQYAHNRGVIHRDIKNSNVLVKRDPTGREVVKVVDFGIVKLRNQKVDLTQVGIILGSPHFMAPEQAQGKDVDHRVDVYAVGVLLYCALAGRYPFNGSHSTAILTAHLTREPPTFAEIAPDLQLPPGLEELVRTCLAKKPAERFPDMASIVTQIDTYTTAREEGPGVELGTMSREAVRKPGVLRNPIFAMTAGAFVTLLFVSIVAITLLLAVLFFQSPAGKDLTAGGETAGELQPKPPKDVEDPVVNTTTRKRAEVAEEDAGATGGSSGSGSEPRTSGGTSSSRGSEDGSTGRSSTGSGSEPQAGSASGSEGAASGSGGQAGGSTAKTSSGSTSSAKAGSSAGGKEAGTTGSKPAQGGQQQGTGAEGSQGTEGSGDSTQMGGGSDLLDPWAN